MNARQHFIRRHNASVSAPELEVLVAKGLEESAHNERARILRSGLVIELFSSLEAFLRDRVAEVLAVACSGPLPFAEFPNALQRLATTAAIDALAFQVRQRGPASPDSMTYVQHEAAAIASTSHAGFQFPSVIFGRSRSNLGAAEVAEFLEGCGVVADPWFQLTSFASRTGFGNFPLRDTYTQAYDARNKAAHDPDSDVEPQFLTDFHRSSLAIAMGFDALLSRVGRLLRDATQGVGQSRRVQANEIRVRFLDRRQRDWAERRDSGSRASNVHTGAEPDLAACYARAAGRGEMVVVRDVTLVPTDWHIADVP